MLPQSAVTLLCLFMRRKERHGYLVFLQYLRNQGRNAHVACVKGEVDRFSAVPHRG